MGFLPLYLVPLSALCALSLRRVVPPGFFPFSKMYPRVRLCAWSAIIRYGAKKRLRWLHSNILSFECDDSTLDEKVSSFVNPMTKWIGFSKENPLQRSQYRRLLRCARTTCWEFVVLRDYFPPCSGNYWLSVEMRRLARLCGQCRTKDKIIPRSLFNCSLYNETTLKDYCETERGNGMSLVSRYSQKIFSIIKLHATIATNNIYEASLRIGKPKHLLSAVFTCNYNYM